MESTPVSTASRSDHELLASLAPAAWAARENAYLFGNTKVGCALITDLGGVFSGCNVEQRFRSHDIHAETNAISAMVAAGHRSIRALIVVANREQFTPCGACMDWIMQFAAEDCTVGFQGSPDATIRIFKAVELMPYYPH